MVDFRFYLITDRKNAGQDPLSLVPDLVKAGLRAIQVREKDLSPVALAAYCRQLQGALATAGEVGKQVQVFLNDRADLALGLGLAGVHLRESSMPLADHAPTVRDALVWGVSTHDVEGAKAAEAAGADFITFGPVYATASKAGMGDPTGLGGLERVTTAVSLPVFALGGVSPDRCHACLESGAHGVAAISAVWNAEDPVKALHQFEAALGSL